MVLRVLQDRIIKLKEFYNFIQIFFPILYKMDNSCQTDEFVQFETNLEKLTNRIFVLEKQIRETEKNTRDNKYRIDDIHADVSANLSIFRTNMNKMRDSIRGLEHFCNRQTTPQTIDADETNGDNTYETAAYAFVTGIHVGIIITAIYVYRMRSK